MRFQAELDSDVIGAGVVQERVRVADLCGEPELVSDVRLGVPVGVDVDLVQDVLAELIEVRAAGWQLERDVVGNERDGARLVRAHERVHIGAVGYRILGDFRGLAMR